MAGTEAAPDTAGGIAAEVLVTGNPLPVQTLIDRKVYSLTADLQHSFGAVTDVLNAIPSVEVDSEGIVSLRGDSNVLLLVDGHPLAQLSGALAGQGLQQLPAQDIERIEVITNPPAQYKSAGAAGVINIITRKHPKAGWSGTLSGSAGDDGRSLLGASASYQRQRLEFSAGLSVRRDVRERVITTDRSVPDDITLDTVLSHNVLDETIHRRVPQARTSLQYALSDTLNLGLSLTQGGRSGLRFFDQTAVSRLASGAEIGMSDRKSYGRERSKDSDARLTLEQKLSRPDERISLTMHRTSFHENEHYDYANTYALPIAAAGADDLNLLEDQVTEEAALDYAMLLGGNGSLKLGYDFERDRNLYGNSGDTVDPASSTLIPDPLITYLFDLTQQIHAAYASYQDGLANWNWQTGVRVERTATAAREVSSSATIAHRYSGAYPSLHVSRTLADDATLSLGVSRRISRPDASALNPYIDRQDTQNLRSGNPDLLPQDTWSYELAYGVENPGAGYSLTGYLRRNRDSVTDFSQPVAPDVILTSKANLPRNDAAGLELTANGRLIHALTYAASANAFRSQIDGTSLGASGLRDTNGVNAKLKLDWHVSAVDTAQLLFTRSDKRLTAQGYVGAINQVNLGYRRQVNAQLAAVATVTDVFDAQTFRRVAITPSFTDVYQRHVTGRVLYLGLVYSFGERRKAREGAFDYAD